jgi:glutathione S-transferase
MHGGFANLRAALPMNIRARYRSFTVWSGVHADIERITSIWRDCLATYGGPYLFGERPGMADAMYAPVCTRFRTYGIELEPRLDAYCERILTLPAMREWIDAAEAEPEAIDELDMEF